MTTAWRTGAEARVRSWLDAWRGSERLLAATMALGLDEATARRGLADELDAWEVPGALQAVLEADAEAMEGRVAPTRVLVVAARTLPASAIRQLLWARVFDAECWLKVARGQEALGEALSEGTGGRLHSLGAERGEAFRLALRDADAVVVLGTDETVAALRAEATPGAAFVGYGHKVSAAIVDGDAGVENWAALARDCVAWDHSGCLSPRLVWVRGDVGAAMAGLGVALEAASRGLPALPPEEAHAQRVAVTRARMLGRQVQGAGGFVLVGGDAEPAAGRRMLNVAREDTETLTQLGDVLSTLGLGAGVAQPLGLPESVRVCPLGEMQRPGLAWRQDGVRPLLGLTRASAG